MRQCQKCGNMILDGQVACAKCGTPVQPEQSNAKQPTPAPTMPVMGQVTPLLQSTASTPTMPAMGQPVQATQPMQSAQPVQSTPQPVAAQLADTSSSSLPPVADKTADLQSSINQLVSEQSSDAQAMNTEQPSSNQPLGAQPTMELTDKKSKISKKTWIIIGICAVLLIAVVIVMVVAMSGGNKGGNSGNNKPNTTIVTETKVQLADYVFSVPDGYSYEMEGDGSVSLTSDVENWIANIYYIGNVAYATLADSFNNVASSYVTTPGVSKVQDAGTISVGGRDYLFIDVIGAEGNATGTYAYTKLGDNVLEVILETSDGEFNHDLLENLNPIIDGAEKTAAIEGLFDGAGAAKIRVNLLEAMVQAPVESPETPAETPEENVEVIEF